jgi:glycosyltransferase involved in cell wall biosynthesis
LLIASGIYPPEIGGPASYVPQLANELYKRGHQVIVVAPVITKIPSIEEPNGFNLVRYERSRKIRYVNFFIESLRAISTLLKAAKGVDLIFSNGLDLPSLIVCKLRKIPLIIKIVGDSAWEFSHTRSITHLNFEEYQNSENLYDKVIKHFYRSPLLTADGIIVPSRYMQEVVIKWGVPLDHIHLVHNAFLEPPAPISYQIEPRMLSGFKLLSAGRLLRLKCFDQIISCISKLKDVNLIIAGEGPEYSKLTKLIHELDLNERVFLTGRISKGELLFLFQNYADAFILNSIHETFPHILLEAISSKVPVIATNVGGVPEIIKNNNGLLIPPDKPSELLIAIEQVIQDHNLRQTFINNSMNILEDFSFKNMIDHTISVFERTIS